MDDNDLPASHRVAQSMGLDISSPADPAATSNSQPKGLSRKAHDALWVGCLILGAVCLVVTYATGDFGGCVLAALLLFLGGIDRPGAREEQDFEAQEAGGEVES